MIIRKIHCLIQKSICILPVAAREVKIIHRRIITISLPTLDPYLNICPLYILFQSMFIIYCMLDTVTEYIVQVAAATRVTPLYKTRSSYASSSWSKRAPTPVEFDVQLTLQYVSNRESGTCTTIDSLAHYNTRRKMSWVGK